MLDILPHSATAEALESRMGESDYDVPEASARTMDLQNFT